MTLTRDQFQLLVEQIQHHHQPMREALLQFHLMTDGPRPMEPARAAALVSRIRSGQPEAIAEARQRLPLLGPIPEPRGPTQRQQRSGPADPSPHLPPHQIPPLQPDTTTAADRYSLKRWQGEGLLQNNPIPAPATIAAVFTRLFGTGPPRAADRPSAKGYTRRELRLILQAIAKHRPQN